MEVIPNTPHYRLTGIINTFLNSMTINNGNPTQQLMLVLSHPLKLLTSFLLVLAFVVLGCHQQLGGNQILKKKKMYKLTFCMKQMAISVMFFSKQF